MIEGVVQCVSVSKGVNLVELEVCEYVRKRVD